jgi:hypothetical protein
VDDDAPGLVKWPERIKKVAGFISEVTHLRNATIGSPCQFDLVTEGRNQTFFGDKPKAGVKQSQQYVDELDLYVTPLEQNPTEQCVVGFLVVWVDVHSGFPLLLYVQLSAVQ